MKVLDIPKSGRLGELVFYRIGSRQFARRHVIPRCRRTAATARARGTLGALAKAWSKLLTEGQRRAWIAAAAKVPSHPRLNQSGPLPGAQHFAGINSARAVIGREMLWEPPSPVVFGPNPVEALSVSQGDEGISLRLSVSGSVVEDIMVFGAAPCSAGRKKCRNVAYLGLLPAPVGGVSDITEMYVKRYGEPEPGKRVFIRTRQQRNGWEGHHKDTSEVVPAKPVVAVMQRRCGEMGMLLGLNELHGLHRLQEDAVAGRGASGMLKPCTREQYRGYTVVSPSQCRRDTGSPSRIWGIGPMRRLCALAKVRRSGHWRELWHGS